MRRLRRGERGSVTIWILGLCVGLLFLGGLSIDLWRAFTERRLLAGMADGAAVAAATALDLEEFRDNAVILLDPAQANDRAFQYLVSHPEWGPDVDATVNATPGSVTVVLEREVEFTLLRVLLPNEEPFTVTVRSLANPTPNP